ncbi:MAG TPA: exodeoxyribonuclease VII small subunit [Candidatus Cloacimonadota bacterium]|nr:exodeoxyribonuclease VII small subunit [Candidatus Cloacimonadota bacterium]
MQENVKIEELSFEQAMKGLEGIAEQMADDSVKLEDLLDLYQEGEKYLVQCRKKLSEAEARIEVVLKARADKQETSADGS